MNFIVFFYFDGFQGFVLSFVNDTESRVRSSEILDALH